MKWYEKGWVIFLFLLFIFPVGAFMLWKYGHWRKPIKVIATVIFAFMFLGALLGNTSTSETNKDVPTEANTPIENSVEANTPTESQPEFIVYEAELSSGYYTAGVDFPSGKYNIEVVSGTGNVSSSNMYSGGLNEMMGIDDGSGLYQQTYANVKLDKKVILNISGGVVIRIRSEAASGEPLTPRNQSITETQTLGNGNWTSGTDFPAGVYDIEAISGSGNVMSDNMFSGGINAIMGTEDIFGLSERSYKNINLPEGIGLSVSGCEITLTPSK